LQFQFPYCTWEFKLEDIGKFGKLVSFNSHTARGSSNLIRRRAEELKIVSIPILHVGVQTQPLAFPRYPDTVSIPILHVGVQMSVQPAKQPKITVSIPILHVGVQTA